MTAVLVLSLPKYVRETGRSGDNHRYIREGHSDE